MWSTSHMCRTNQINDGSKHELGPATSYQMSSEQERVHHRYHPPNHEAAKQEMTGKKATETAMMKAGKQENSGKINCEIRSRTSLAPPPSCEHPPPQIDSWKHRLLPEELIVRYR